MIRSMTGLVLSTSLLAGAAGTADEAPAAPTTTAPPLETIYHRCQHTKGEAAKEILDTLTTPRGRVTFSESLNLLVVTDEAEHLKLLQKSIDRIDIAQPQVLVEARVVEITLDSDLEKEIDLTYGKTAASGVTDHLQSAFGRLPTPGADTDSTRGFGVNARILTSDDASKKLDGFIRFLLTQNKARILSSPNIVVDGGSEASIITGEEVPIQTVQNSSGTTSTSTTFKRVGIKLKVKPLQIGSDTVRLEVSPEVSSVTGFTTPGSTPGAVSNPIVAVRSTKTVLNLKNDQTLVIGGLKRQENRELTRKVPLLGDIPLLGGLFRSKRTQTVNTMLVFYLRVEILNEGAAPSGKSLDTPELRKEETKEEEKIREEHDRTRKTGPPW